MTRRSDVFKDLPPLRLEIDEYNLQGEWQGQPQLMADWTAHCADAVYANDQAKAELELAKAVAAREIREDPASFGLTKATETTVPLAVLEQPEVMAAQKAWHKTKYAVAVLNGVVSAVEDRRRALQKIVDLHGQDYFSEPKASKPSRRPKPPKGLRSRRAKDDDDD